MSAATVLKYGPIGLVREAAANRGSYWFEPSTMRFFNSRVSRHYIALDSGEVLFVSSERFEESPEYPRRYSIRRATWDPWSYDGKFDIETVGEFQQYDSGAQAWAEIRRIAGGAA